MMFDLKRHTIVPFFVIVLYGLIFSSQLFAQKYLLGEEQQLEMIVHIIGEVKKPGEYRVHDKTNVVELLSKAMGPTEFSKLGSVTISRVRHDVLSNGSSNGRIQRGSAIIKVNLDDYIKKGGSSSPPILKPGDVVYVPRNSWSKWRNVSTIVRDLAVIASVYFLYLRSTN